MKKYIEFIKESDLESDIKHIFDDMLEEYNLQNLEFQIRKVDDFGEVCMRVIDGEKIEFASSGIRDGVCIEVLIGHIYIDNMISAHKVEMEFKKILKDSDMVEAIEDRMLDIGYKFLGKYTYLDDQMFGRSPGVNMFFDFKKIKSI